MLGLGLWNSVVGTLLIELTLLAAGVFIYTRGTRPRDGDWPLGLCGRHAFLAVGFVATALAPPPPSVQAVWMGAIGRLRCSRSDSLTGSTTIASRGDG